MRPSGVDVVAVAQRPWIFDLPVNNFPSIVVAYLADFNAVAVPFWPEFQIRLHSEDVLRRNGRKVRCIARDAAAHMVDNTRERRADDVQKR